jgi:hypothetical protein
LRTRFTARGEDRMFRDTFYAFGIISRLRGAVARWRGFLVVLEPFHSPPVYRTLILLGHKIFVELGCPEPGKS